MDINYVINRFSGRDYILYGGDVDMVSLLNSVGNVITWYTNRYNETTSPPQQLYDRFIQNMDVAMKDVSPLSNAIMVIVGDGYVNGMRAELFASRMFRIRGYNDGVIIFHGYNRYVTMGSGTVMEKYDGGVVVVKEDSRTLYLQELAQILSPSTEIPLPIKDEDMIVGSPVYEQVKDLLPYTHIVSRIREDREIPYTSEMPLDVIDMNDRERQMVYDSDQWTSAVHWGQRKLLLSEIELLVEVISNDIRNGGTGRDFLIVYVGAAPGSHIPYLMELFAPKRSGLRIHVWDRPSRFDSIEDTTVPIEQRVIRITPSEFADPNMTGDYEGFFTDYVAQKYIDRYGTDNRIIFISDIRDRASEEAVHEDMMRQQDWVLALQPYASQLKFRLPFSGDKEYRYLKGDVYTQAWSRTKSTEGRLLSYRPYTYHMYQVDDYDRLFSYFNVKTRMQSYNMGAVLNDAVQRYGGSTTSVVDSYIPIPVDGLCTCHDCAREIQIIGKYMGMYKYTPTISSITGFVHRNTRESRPRVSISNRRTLWDRVNPKVVPYDRKNLVVYEVLPSDPDSVEKEINIAWRNRISNRDIDDENDTVIITDKTLDVIRIPNTSKILIYGDGYTPDEIVDLLLSKTDNKPFFDSPTSIRSVLRGHTPTMVVNFHTDFIPKYDPLKDRGTVGNAIYQQYLQGTAIKGNGNLHQQLLMFSLSRSR